LGNFGSVMRPKIANKLSSQKGGGEKKATENIT